MHGTWKATFCSRSVRASRDGQRRRFHRLAISRITSREWATRWTVWRKAASARPPKPTRAASPERLQRAIRKEDLYADARLRVDVVERLMPCALLHDRSHRMSPRERAVPRTTKYKAHPVVLTAATWPHRATDHRGRKIYPPGSMDRPPSLAREDRP
jgi:hypothetical protein